MNGVLPSQDILRLVEHKHLTVHQAEHHIQPNSIDLPLGKRCWRLSSIRTPRKNETVAHMVRELAIDELDLTKPAIFERNAVYVAELAADVDMPPDVHGECDSKSSTGRIDVQTRLLTDFNERYDSIAPGHKGKLYLFVSSNSFLIRVQHGICLNQARFAKGDPVLSDEALAEVAAQRGLLYVAGKPAVDVHARKGIAMRLDLQQPIAGYKAKFTNHVVDLTRTDNPVDVFWETIPGGAESLTLERNQFYILSTLEAVRVPHDYCAWIPPFRPEFGEFRSHYAGFFDSGWGFGGGDLAGATATLEVRSQDNSLTLLHGTPVAPLLYLRLLAKPDRIYSIHTKNNYQGQTGPRLAKYFA